MNEMKISIPAQDVAMVIDTLKRIADSGGVKGYDNMNRLVATVVYFEGLLSAIRDSNPEAERIKEELIKRGEA